MKSGRFTKLLGLLIALAVVLTTGQAQLANASKVPGNFEVAKDNNFQSAKFEAYNPDNPSEVKEIEIGKSYWKSVPANWKVRGKIVMKPTNLAVNNAGSGIDLTDFKMEVTGQNKDAYVTYTLEDYDPPTPADANIANPHAGGYDNASIRFNTSAFKIAQFYLEGGTWTETSGWFTAHGNRYETFIAPGETVAKPSDPTREGYTFLGWSGTSNLELGNPQKYTKDSPYKFDQKEQSIVDGRANPKTVAYSGQIKVELRAMWAKNPVVEGQDKVITVGDNFKPKDLVKSAVDFEGTDLKDKVTFEGKYDPDKVGVYPVTLKVTDSLGAQSKPVTANLVVNPVLKLTGEVPNIPFGDKNFNFKSLIDTPGSKLGGQTVQIDSSNVNFNEPGNYEVTYTVNDAYGKPMTQTATVTVGKPVPDLKVNEKTINEGDPFKLTDLFEKADPEDKVYVDPTSEYDPHVAGEYDIKYVVINKYGVSEEKTAKLIVKKQWTPIEAAPALKVKDIEINEGGEFNVKDFVESPEEGVNYYLDPDAKFNTAVAGEYPVSVIAEKDGKKTTKTAKLIVKKELTPLTPAPTLELKDLEITAGESFDLSDMIGAHDGGTVTVNPDSKFDANKPGTYEIKFTVIGENGAKTTKTAKLVVKPAPATPAPQCEDPASASDPKAKKKAKKSSKPGLPTTGAQGAAAGIAAIAAIAGGFALLRRKKN
ncbi:bacterial Ig-like domain-containing protein [Propionimicrobium lymphophilum]|uniref:LPXTG-domain-containing protein cell wall anchor domain n=1 Tax=Propionimicrobium lymphophilum ACS-093-V-SCH5 TaxID=883161 RepID=S2WW81_9ACTN|nr:immunoglobulin-like domain-containing protein [Propionimicrobium lymphophilum]EPD31994.1 hypothetical protein HMPREF9306_01554 [Propionimicrobium lymphophilum ACS-093-V-SCH5]MDK7710148.1 bacterial Ig-like domain-containing protein [Propionimicrobium lymphophilum]MDK7734163.1 bacterial Ig-like domain-containing protein [Propionimicrobium lymphophilum]